MQIPNGLKLCLLFTVSSCATPVGLDAELESGGAGGGSPNFGAGSAQGVGGNKVGSGGSSSVGGSGGGASNPAAGGGASNPAAGGGSGGASGGGGIPGGGGGGSGGVVCSPPVPGGLCDTFAQCGCSANQNCDVAGPSGFTSCFPVGPKSAYQSCSTQTDCGKGTSCVSYACKPFCQVDTDCAQPAARCVQVYMGTPVPGWRSCTAGCDLTNPSAVCGAGATCMVVLPDISDCVGGAGSGVGPGTCWPGNEIACAPGHACRPDGSCAKWCRIGQNDCPSGSTCSKTPLTTQANGLSFGTCS